MKTLGDDVKANLGEGAEVVFSFDTTGSMYPCLEAVRRDVAKTCQDLFSMFPGLKIGLISHGDYCDGQLRINSLPLTDERQTIEAFIRNTPATGGGDAPECYELALHTAAGMNWTTDKGRMVVLIGDDEPHPPDYPQNELRLDWRETILAMKEWGVKVFPIQCLYSPARQAVNAFWEEVATLSGTRLFRFDAGQNFGQFAVPTMAGMVAAAGGSDVYERYCASEVGAANNARLHSHVVSGMMCAAKSFDRPAGSSE